MLPHLQELCSGSIKDNIVLVLSAFRQKEPEFTGKAIDFVIAACKDLDPASKIFEAHQLKGKRRLSTSRQVSDSHKSGHHNVKRRRSSFPSQSASRSNTASLPDDISSTVPYNQPSSADNLNYILLNKFIPPNLPRR